MDSNYQIRGQERYKQSFKSVDKSLQGSEAINSYRSTTQFGRTSTVSDPKRVSVVKPAASDTKLEGFSVSKQNFHENPGPQAQPKGVENEFINNLQQQIYYTELEIKLLKDQENARSNKFMGGLEAGPLTENLVMLKGKYKKIQDELQGKIDELTHENRELLARNNTANINYSRFIEDIKDFEYKLAHEREVFDKESEKYRKAISTASFLKEENAKILADTIKARDLSKAYTGETRIKLERQATFLASLEDKLAQAEAFKQKIHEEKNKQILSLQEKLSSLQEDLKSNSTVGIAEEQLTFLNSNKQEVEMERDNLLNKIKSLKQTKNLIEKTAASLASEKRALASQVEELKMQIERDKTQQEAILTRRLKQKQEKDLTTNIIALEDTRSENENAMVKLKDFISNNAELSEERTKLHYDIEELKEKKEM